MCLHKVFIVQNYFILPQVQAARVLEIPVIATEQYPKGLLIRLLIEKVMSS
jgi:hypothetical protein